MPPCCSPGPQERRRAQKPPPPNLRRPTEGPDLHRHRALLVGAADAGGLLVVAGDDADALVEFGADALRSADFEKGDAVVAAGAEHLVARILHLRRIRISRHLAIAEREAEITRPDLGEADSRDGQDLLAAGDPLRAFQLDPEQ